MPCIDFQLSRCRAGSAVGSRWGSLGCLMLLLLVLVGLAGCSGLPLRKKPQSPPPTQPAAPVTPPPPPVVVAPPTAPPAAPELVPPAAARYRTLGPPTTPRNAEELRLQMAWRLVAAHPGDSYTTRAPDRLLAIPVLEVELNADGSVRRIDVLRRPTTGDEATQLAIAAVRRAAPYGDVSRLPRPWKVVETFLFDDRLRFKPRTLD